jgi:hypothetical protein
MAYQFADGFDNYNTATEMYDFVQGTPAISSAYARFAPPSGIAGQGIQIQANGYLVKNMQSNQPTFIIKIAYNFPEVGVVNAVGCRFLGARDAGTWQWTLVVFPDGALAIYSGLGSTLQVISEPGVLKSDYQGIECQVTVGASGSGSAQVWVNGLEVINATGITTQATANAYANQVHFGDAGNLSNQNTQADDFRVWDNTGTSQNAPLGASVLDSRLITKLPSGAGSFTQFTPNGASANWQCVDDNPPDGDTTYVSGSTAGLKDAYAMPVANFTKAPVMVLSRAYARKDDGATRELAVGVDSSGNTSTGPTYVLSSSYAFYDGCIPLDPNGSIAWTAASADAAQHFKEEIA